MKGNDQQGMYGPKLLSRFRVAAGGCLTLDWPEESTFAITRISSDIGLSDFTETVSPGPAMLTRPPLQPFLLSFFQPFSDPSVIVSYTVTNCRGISTYAHKSFVSFPNCWLLPVWQTRCAPAAS